MIASAQTLLDKSPLKPFYLAQQTAFGMTFGPGSAGYDIRVDQHLHINPGEFVLAASLEQFHMPDDLLGVVHDKSTWVRQGLTVQNTVIEPGWRGYLTLELINHSNDTIILQAGMPIAQIIFHLLDHPTQCPYAGKYQDQPPGPQPAILEKE